MSTNYSPLETREAALIQAVIDLEEIDVRIAMEAILEELEEARRVLPQVAKRAAAQTIKSVRDYLSGDGSADICHEQSRAIRTAIFDVAGVPMAGPPLDVAQKEYSAACADLARVTYDPDSLGLSYSVQGLAEAYRRHPQGAKGKAQAYDLVTSHLQERLADVLNRQGRVTPDRSRISLLAL